MDKRAAVVGLGDFFAGDFGAGGYVLEALQQEPKHPRVSYAFLGLEAWKTGLCTQGNELVFIVHGVSAGLFPGTLRSLDLPAYQSFCRLSADVAPLCNSVLDSLAKAALFSPAPDLLRFLLIEIQNNSGLCLSKPVCQSVRKAVQHISRSLVCAGFHSSIPANVSRVYRLELLSLAV